MPRAMDIVATALAKQRYIGLLADPGIARMLINGREAEAKTLSNQIWNGTSYWLDRDVMPPLVEAAKEVPDVAVFTPDMAPSPVGFLTMARPWPIATSDGVRDIVALSWEFVTPVDTPDDYSMRAAVITAWSDKGDGLAWTIGAEPLVKPIGEFKIGMDGAKALYTLFAFLRKRILVSARADTSRAQRRGCEWTDSPEVFVIVYRKTQNRQREKNDPAPVDWSCRWLSRQHWGIRYHGSGDQRVPVVTLISASIKGPEGKPMRVSPVTLGAIIR